MKRLFFKINPSFLIAPALTLLFFIPFLLQGKIPMPADAILGLYHPWRDNSYANFSPEHFPVKNPLITDSVLQTYPWRQLVISNFKTGQWPLWNPYNFSGQPLLANIQSAPFQILNIFFFIFPFKIAWAITIIGPPVVMSLFMYLFLRSLKLGTSPSIYGAFILPFTGYFITWLSWGNMVSTAMWLPLVLLCLNKLIEKPKGVWFLILLFATSQIIFSGFWQTAFYTLFASFLYLAYLLLTKPNLKNLLVILLAFSTGIVIASVQILPSWEFINNSARETDQGYYPLRQDWFFPPKHLVGIISPDYFGNPATYNYWGVWNYLEFAFFIGIVPLTLAIFALTKLTKQTKFLLITLLLILFVALPNPVSKYFLTRLPLISTMQPSRIIMLLDFFLVVLAAFGLSNLISEKSRKKSFLAALFVLITILVIVAFTFFSKNKFPQVNDLDTARIALRNLAIPLLTALVFAVILFLKKNVSPKLLIITVFVISLLELFRFGYKFNSFTKPSLIFPETKTTTFLESQNKPFRVMVTDRRVFSSSTPSIYNIEVVHGYDPLFLKDYAKLVSSWDSGKITGAGKFNRIVTPNNFQSNIADLLNIKYVVSFDEISNPKLSKVFEEGQTKIYQNLYAMPRAFFPNQVVRVKDKDEELARMLETNFDPLTVAFSSQFQFSKINGTNEVNFEKYTDQSILLSTLTQSAAPLVITNVLYPGWTATIDGRPTEINRINYIFQSIIVPEGSHQIEFKYLPKSFYNGLKLSAITIVLTALIYLVLWRKKYLS